jgi:2-polyprenyl-3-methyl-5-hydroxy-6-metoxy-1,4-benzoquinol methylase
MQALAAKRPMMNGSPPVESEVRRDRDPAVLPNGPFAPVPRAEPATPEPSGQEEAALSPAATSVMQRFDGLKTPSNQHFFRALAVHLAASHDDPCLPMYFEFALSANERGRKAADLIEAIVPLAGKRALDVGCAYGGFLVALGECGAEPTGFDIDEALLALAAHNFRDADRSYPLHRADVTDPDDVAAFHDTFDIISCNDVIEHVHDPAVTIAHIASMLHTGGVAYFEIPNRDAVAAVMADGHYQLFGITQLDQETARRYYGAHAPGLPYGVEHYLKLDEYRTLFEAAGLSMELVPDAAARHAPDVIVGALDELREALPERLAQVPLVVRDDVERAVLHYLEEASAPHRSDPRSFVDRYGRDFWRIVARKR